MESAEGFVTMAMQYVFVFPQYSLLTETRVPGISFIVDSALNIFKRQE